MSGGEAGKSPTGELAVLGYCVHCRERRQMSGAIQVCNRRGGRDLKGLCSICGKSMYRLGGWDSVAAAAQEAARVEAVRSETEQQASGQDTAPHAPPSGGSSPNGDAATIAPPALSESVSPVAHSMVSQPPAP